MAHTLEQLGRQEQTLAGIGGIVRTMKALAAINASPYEQAAQSIQAWQQTVDLGLRAFAFRMRGQALRGSAAVQGRILIAFGSDHGFCGNYNALQARAVQQWRAQRPRAQEVVLCIGARLQRALAEHGIDVARRLTPPASADGIGRLAGQVVTQVQQLAQGRPLDALEVDLAYTRREPQHGSVAQVTQLLPLAPQLLQAPQRWPGPSLPDFRMEPAQLFSALVRSHIFARVFRASAEAMVTENAARLALMQQAEQSVQERLEQVRRDLAGVRQDAITDELMDIVIGHAGGAGS